MNPDCDLLKKKCLPCEGGIPPLKGTSLDPLHQQLGGNWKIIDQHHLEKEYRFKNFRDALAFTNTVGAIAEEEGHHPDLLLSYGKVKIQTWTHKINGLTENDFILAAKIDSQVMLPSKQAIVQSYFDGLEKGSYPDVIQLFSSNALVHSPLYGQVEASHCYKELFSDTKSSKIELKHIFLSTNNPNKAAALFVYSWTLKNGTLTHFECVDIFDFTPNSSQIQTLTILYDTYHTRPGFSKLR